MAINSIGNNANLNSNSTNVQRNSGENARLETPARAETVQQGRANTTTGPTSEVTLSPQASRLSQIENSIAATSEVNQERVDQIRAAIDDGSFNVDAESIANRLLEQDGLF